MSHEFEDTDDFLTENIFKTRKKKINGKKKGNRVELELTKIFSNRFNQSFSRTVASGARWSQATLPKHAAEIFAGDVVTPESFLFVLEIKGGYSGIEIDSVFLHGNSELDKFLKQAESDAIRVDKKPMLCWKRDRKPWLAFVKSSELEGCTFEYYLKYREWTAVALEHVLKLDDSFFMN